MDTDLSNIDNAGTSPRKGPNFLLIVILASITILLILIASFFTIDWKGRHLVPKGFGSHPHPTATLTPHTPARLTSV